MIERVDRTVALGHREDHLAVDIQRHGGFRHFDLFAARVVGAFDHDAEAAHLEEIRHQAEIPARQHLRSEEHTTELQSLMRISYDVVFLKTIRKNINLTYNRYR